jgi:hypothetical protein
MSLTACDSLFELYDACRSSGVTIRSDLIPLELEMVNAVMADLTSAP